MADHRKIDLSSAAFAGAGHEVGRILPPTYPMFPDEPWYAFICQFANRATLRYQR